MEKEFREPVKLARRELRPSLVEFLQPYESEPEKFIDACYGYPNNIPARMLHGLQRLMELANASEPHELKVFWVCVCAESLVKLSGSKQRGSKQRVIDFFELYIDAQDRLLLQSLIKRSLEDEEFDPNGQYFEGDFSTYIDLSTIIEALYSVRSALTHGYDIYGFAFASAGLENAISIGYPNDRERIFSVGISVEQFRDVVVRTGLSCIRNYLA